MMTLKASGTDWFSTLRKSPVYIVKSVGLLLAWIQHPPIDINSASSLFRSSCMSFTWGDFDSELIELTFNTSSESEKKLTAQNC